MGVGVVLEMSWVVGRYVYFFGRVSFEPVVAVKVERAFLEVSLEALFEAW